MCYQLFLIVVVSANRRHKRLHKIKTPSHLEELQLRQHPKRRNCPKMAQIHLETPQGFQKLLPVITNFEGIVKKISRAGVGALLGCRRASPSAALEEAPSSQH